MFCCHGNPPHKAIHNAQMYCQIIFIMILQNEEREGVAYYFLQRINCVRENNVKFEIIKKNLDDFFFVRHSFLISYLKVVGHIFL